MRDIAENVRSAHDPERGRGYVVTLPDGTEEWWCYVWQATARARGWMPPTDPLTDQGRQYATRAYSRPRPCLTINKLDQPVRQVLNQSPPK